MNDKKLIERKIGVKEQEDLFNLIGRTLKKRVVGYVVGGTAMIFLNLKEKTKDIDIVFAKRNDYETFKDVLLELGAKQSSFKIINPEKISAILELGEARFDLFFENLIQFRLTASIISRVREAHEFFNLVIKIVSPEDIVLFKSFANRESDRVDVVEILRKINVDWDIILKEAEEQMKNSEYFFPAFLFNFLVEIREDFKIEIPKEFMKRLEKIAERCYIEAEKRLKVKDTR